MDKISERITSERTNKGTKCSCWILYNKLTTPAERGGALEKTYIYIYIYILSRCKTQDKMKV